MKNIKYFIFISFVLFALSLETNAQSLKCSPYQKCNSIFESEKRTFSSRITGKSSYRNQRQRRTHQTPVNNLELQKTFRIHHNRKTNSQPVSKYQNRTFTNKIHTNLKASTFASGPIKRAPQRLISGSGSIPNRNGYLKHIKNKFVSESPKNRTSSRYSSTQKDRSYVSQFWKSRKSALEEKQKKFKELLEKSPHRKSVLNRSVYRGKKGYEFGLDLKERKKK